MQKCRTAGKQGNTDTTNSSKYKYVNATWRNIHYKGCLEMQNVICNKQISAIFRIKVVNDV